ncbi:MAG: hypothetical protein JWO03_2944 [Bacteroidetes bacterium]|nr:hypothetical protein [Bacteroidota bacterium]
MKKLITLASILFSFSYLHSQNVGIGNNAPGTKLDVSGAITHRETSVAVVSNAATIPANVSQVQLTGAATATITLTAPAAPPNAGQVLVIYNNTTGGFSATYGSTSIPSGAAVEFIYSSGAWVATASPASGSGNYVQNRTTQQPSSDFNVSNTGTVGTTFTAGTSVTAPTVQGSTAASGTLTLKSTSSTTKPAAGILMTDNIASTSTTTGTAVVTGGVGVSGNVNAGGTITAGGSAILGTGINGGYYQDGTNGAYRSIVSSATTNGFYIQSNAGATTTMYVGLGGTYNGNVGIGTTTPAAGLQLFQDKYSLYGPNSTWSSYLRVGGNGNVDNNASVVTTNGNLHLDASSVGPGTAMYLNFYKGTGGINFGNGATGVIGSVDATGYLTMNNAINSAIGYRVNGAAPSGQYLRGNGTNFVSSAIQPGDLSGAISGSTNRIPKFTGANSLGNSQTTDDGTNIVFAPVGYSYFSQGTVYAQSTIIARGGVNNDGGTLTLTGSSGVVNAGSSYLQVAGKYVVDGTDAWLRINQQNSYSNGTYTPYFLRTDGGFASGGIGGLGGGTINASGVIRGAGFQDANGNQVIDNGGGWHRSYGATGWYNGTYAGGWWMQDASYLRTYNDRQIFASGGMIIQGTASTAYGTNATIYANNANTNGGGVMISDDGGFFDYNDGPVTYRGSTGLKIVSNSTTYNTLFSMYDQNGTGPSDKPVSSSTAAWGLLGQSGLGWWQIWGYSFNNASARDKKKDINAVSGSLSDLVMSDLDKLHPYMYRYKEETDEWKPGYEAKYRPGLHMGLILDESPDYIKSQSFDGVDIYAVATLGVAAGKANRDEIKQIKQSIGLNDETMTVQDFGSKQMSGAEMFVSFGSDFSAKLGNEIPSVTVTSNTPGTTLAITEKTSKGFKVVSSSLQAVSFDYIAMAKVKNNMAEKKEAIPSEVMSRVHVSDDVRTKAKGWWDAAPQREKEREDKERAAAKVIQEQQAKKFAVKGDPAKESLEQQKKYPASVALPAPMK